MRVKPADPNAVIRDPITKMPLPAEGADVPDNVFWQRRLLENRKHPGFGVVLCDAPAHPVGDEPIKPLTTR